MILRRIGEALDAMSAYVEAHDWAGAVIFIGLGLLVTFGDVLQAAL